MYVSTNRLRVRMTGGRVGNGGTATNASGDWQIVHGVGTVRTCGVTLETSGAGAGSNQYSQWTTTRVSGTVLVVKVTSLGAAKIASTQQAYWYATA